ncbi:MAG: TM2 domain-containing protein [Clostridiales bacterium]|nr:TM2 domain-containing protein [Clostridiales bacterium]
MNDLELKKFVGEKHIEEVRALIGEKGQLPRDLKLKNPKVTLVLSIFLGMVGIDRLYQKGVKLFLYKIAMLTLTLGVWWIPDIGYSIPVTREMNYEKIIAAM